jgi:hypothetical protein
MHGRRYRRRTCRACAPTLQNLLQAEDFQNLPLFVNLGQADDDATAINSLIAPKILNNFWNPLHASMTFVILTSRAKSMKPTDERLSVRVESYLRQLISSVNQNPFCGVEWLHPIAAAPVEQAGSVTIQQLSPTLPALIPSSPLARAIAAIDENQAAPILR